MYDPRQKQRHTEMQTQHRHTEMQTQRVNYVHGPGLMQLFDEVNSPLNDPRSICRALHFHVTQALAQQPQSTVLTEALEFMSVGMNSHPGYPQWKCAPYQLHAIVGYLNKGQFLVELIKTDIDKPVSTAANNSAVDSFLSELDEIRGCLGT